VRSLEFVIAAKSIASLAADDVDATPIVYSSVLCVLSDVSGISETWKVGWEWKQR
jgi:hypothetical protein